MFCTVPSHHTFLRFLTSEERQNFKVDLLNNSCTLILQNFFSSLKQFNKNTSLKISPKYRYTRGPIWSDYHWTWTQASEESNQVPRPTAVTSVFPKWFKCGPSARAAPHNQNHSLPMVGRWEEAKQERPRPPSLTWLCRPGAHPASSHPAKKSQDTRQAAVLLLPLPEIAKSIHTTNNISRKFQISLVLWRDQASTMPDDPETLSLCQH